MGHIDGRHQAAHVNQLIDILRGILRALHILSLIDEQIGLDAIILDELVRGQTGGIQLLQRVGSLIHQAGGGQDMGQVQTALVHALSFSQRYGQIQAFAHIGVGRVILVCGIFLIQRPQRLITLNGIGRLAQVFLHLRQTSLLFGDNLRLLGNQAVQPRKAARPCCRRPESAQQQ